MNHEEWLEQADVYALDALDGEERGRFEAHLAAGCETCEHHLRESREALALLPRALTAVAPPTAVRTRVLAEIARERPAVGSVEPIPAPTRGRWMWWGGWVGVAAAAGLLLIVNQKLTETETELERLRGRLTTLQEELAQREETLRFLSDPAVRYVSLAGLRASPGASAWLLWNPASRTGLLLTRGLPPAPPDRAYELWALAGAEPVPAGVFTVDQSGRALLRVAPLPERRTFDKFAVTLEPAGGVPKPTGPMHLLGAL
jgi:anti-sigma-K factor RskA